MGLNPVLKNGVAAFTGTRATDLATLSDAAWGTWTGSHYPLTTSVGTFTSGTAFQRVYAKVKVNDFFKIQLSSSTANGNDGVLFKFFNSGKSVKIWAPQVVGYPSAVGGMPTYAEARTPDWVTVGATYEILVYSSSNGFTAAIKYPTTGQWAPVVSLTLKNAVSNFQTTDAYTKLFDPSKIYAAIFADGGTPEFAGLTISYNGYIGNPYAPDGGSTRPFYRADFTGTYNPYDFNSDTSLVIYNQSMTKWGSLPAAGVVFSSGGNLYVAVSASGRSYILQPNTNGYYPNPSDYGHYYLKIEGLAGGLGFANVIGQALYFNSNVSGTQYPVTLEANGSR